MSYTQPKTPHQLKDYILERLGAPIINIEVTPSQIYQCIQRALELYGDYHFNGLNKTYVAVRINDEEQYKNGVFDLSDSNVFAITDIVRSSGSSFLTMDGVATYTWASDFILGLTGFGGCKSFGPNAFGADLGYFTTIMQYWDMMKKMFDPIESYWFNDDTGQLKLSGNFKKGEIIVMECWVKSFIDTDDALGSYAGHSYAHQQPTNPWSTADIYNDANKGYVSYKAGDKGASQGAYNNRWVKDYATALVKELNGSILAKHQGLQLAGGVTIDGVRLIEEARLEKERLREELELLEAPMGILIG